MKNNKGFTMVELIVVITILSIVLVITIPNIVNTTSKSKISIYNSKIKALEVAGEKYGNAYINKYRGCKGTTLTDDCLIAISDLVSQKYITPDDDNKTSLIDPKTNQPFTGYILLCYDPNKINVYAKYIERDDSPSCGNIDVETGEYFYLGSNNKTAYIGGDPVEVTIFKDKNAGNLQFHNYNEALVDCEIVGNKLRLKVRENATITNESETVKIDVKAANRDKTLTYTLIVVESSLKIVDSESTEKCINTNTSKEFKITGKNQGKLNLDYNKELVNVNTKSNDTLVINTLDKTGDMTVTVQENNGKKQDTIKKTIYKLELDKELPSGLLLGNKNTFNLEYGGNDSVTITVESATGAVKLYKDNENNLSDSIVLSGSDKTFSIKALNLGDSKITIRGNKCGLKEYNLSVSSLHLEDKTSEVFIGGGSFNTKIVSDTSDTYTCSSSDADAATCEISDSTLIVIPGHKVSNNTAITVYGSNGGYDTINVETKMTSIKLLNRNKTEISRVCSHKNSGPTDEVTVEGTNMGALSVSSISDQNLLGVTISGNKVIPSNKSLDSLTGLSSNYKLGVNTGISTVKIKESNGNKEASFDYTIFDILTESGNSYYEVTAGSTKQIKIKSSATGSLSAVSSDPSVAEVTVDNPSYSYDVNNELESILNVTGKKTGTSTITVTGSFCGTLVITIEVVGQEFYLNLELGTYTIGLTGVSVGKVSCLTEGSNDDCYIDLPDFVSKAGFTKYGFSSVKDSKNQEYNVNDVIRVDKSNSGTTLYANSIDEVKPECVFKDDMSSIKLNVTEYYTLVCEESGSGADKRITKDSFIISDPSVAELANLQGPEEILDSSGRVLGYSYKVGLQGKSMIGTFDLSLKENELVDKFGNGNDEIIEENINVAEYKSIRKWYIGKENETDVLAVLYFNKDLPEDIKQDFPDDTYTLKFYGTGETKDYAEEEFLTIPWVAEGFQEFIKNVIVDEGVTAVGDFILENLYNMEQLKLPDSLEKMGKGSFRENSSLKSIKMPPLIKTIPSNAFEKCTNLESVELNQGLEKIEDFAFASHAIRELVIPASVIQIGFKAFESNIDKMQLTKLEFENESQLTKIDYGAFGYHKLTALNIPASVQTISSDAFKQDANNGGTLTDLTFDSNSDLQTINNYVFSNCNLNDVKLPDSLIEIGNDVFTLGDASTFELGANIAKLGTSFVMGSNLREIIVDPNNENFTTHDGVIYTKDMTELVKFPEAYYKDHSSYSIPEGVMSLQASAFYGTFTHSDTVSFELNIPASLVGMGPASNFTYSAISKYNIDPLNEKFSSIDGVIYSKDGTAAYSLPRFYESEEYTMPENVTTIEGYFAVGNYTVKKITIPESVTNIKLLAFYSDPYYSFSTINLNSDQNVTLGSYSLDTYMSDYTRNISVKTEDVRLAVLGALDSKSNISVTVGE